VTRSRQIRSVTFEPRTAGTHSLSFRSGAILAADGRGTNIITEMRAGAFTITAASVDAAPEYVSPAGSPTAPTVEVSSHPQEGEWYAQSRIEASWQLPSDVSAVRVLLDRNPHSVPTVQHEPPISSRTIDDVADGEWYLHVQFRNEHGWGRITHRRILIDTLQPEYFEIREPHERDESDPRAQFLFDAYDAVSGISHYEVQLAGEPFARWDDDGTGIFRVPTLSPGVHTLVARAFDHAGNYITNSVVFRIQALDAPQLTEYPDFLAPGSVIAIRGIAQPDADVAVWISRGRGEPARHMVRAGEDGHFSFIAPDTAESGIYQIWAQAHDGRGAQSEPSQTITFAVSESMFAKVGSAALNFLSVIIPLLALIVLLFVGIVYSRHRLTMLRKRLKKEVHEAEIALHDAFTTLRKAANKNIAMLEKVSRQRELTAEEQVIMNDLKKNLAAVEKNVEREIKDIEDVLKRVR
jgi:hypothetical protein